MVIPLRRLGLVTQRCDARQITKIMDQMRLIGIAVFRCQRAPVRLRGTAHRAQDSLQAMHTGKPFWSNPHLVGKPARECPGKKTDRKSTRLNSSHGYISYAVFCLKKKKKTKTILSSNRTT